MEQKIKIQKSHIILCEGRDEERFLISWLNSQDIISHYSVFSSDIQVVNFGGNDELQQKLQLLTHLSGFDEIVKSILIVRDAEQNVGTAIAQIQNALKSNHFNVPQSPGKWEDANLDSSDVKIAYLLFPSLTDDPTNGTLEDLCASILSESSSNNILKKVDDFFITLENHQLRTFPHKFKSRIHTYFSITDKYVSLKIGEAADAGAFDWESDEFNYIKSLLREVTGE